jgi:7-cyano-7-deazaguanine synthase
LERVAVLASGGLDSSILLWDMARLELVYPLYVHAGLAWEELERQALERFARALGSPNVRPVTDLSVPARELYGEHWSLTGQGVPGAEAPYDAVFLPGRNVLLIGLAAVWCSTHGVSRIAIGSLGGNPFADATPEFFEEYGGVLTRGLGHQVVVVAPYRGLTKADLVRSHSHLPLELTLTCAAPMQHRGGVHCGRCSKCHERRQAFAGAGVTDRTAYDDAGKRGTPG